jgi:hypothetical protein
LGAGLPVGTPQDQRRDSPIVELSLLLAECMQHGLRTIAFCKVRLTEWTCLGFSAGHCHLIGLTQSPPEGKNPCIAGSNPIKACDAAHQECRHALHH